MHLLLVPDNNNSYSNKYLRAIPGVTDLQRHVFPAANEPSVPALVRICT